MTSTLMMVVISKTGACDITLRVCEFKYVEFIKGRDSLIINILTILITIF